MHKHYDKTDMQRVQVDWLRDNLQPADKRSGKGQNHYLCPFCGKPDVYNPWFDKGRFHCFACDRGGSVFDVVAFRDGLSIGDAIRSVMERYNRGGAIQSRPGLRGTTSTSRSTGGKIDEIGGDNGRDVLKWRLICQGYCVESAARFIGSPGQQYAEGRGFTLETCNRFGVGFDAEAFKEDRGTGGALAVGVPALILPYGPRREYYGGRLLRPLGKTKYMKPGGDVAGAEPLYNGGALWRCDVCFICEGWADVLTVYQTTTNVEGLTVGAVGLNGTGHRALIEALKHKPTRTRLIVALDDDDAGRRGAVRVGRELDSIGAKYGIWFGGFAGYGKDFGDLLKRGRAEASEIVQGIARDSDLLLTASEAAEALEASESP